MDLLGQFFWNLYSICKAFPNATGTVIGIVIGTLAGTWAQRSLIISMFEKYMGINNKVLVKLENHEQRLVLLETKQH